MAEKMEMSLEDIIKAEPGMVAKDRRRVVGSMKHAPTNIHGRGNQKRHPETFNRNNVWSGRTQATNNRADFNEGSLLIANLEPRVTETDLHELFVEFGPLKSVMVHYDRSGQSLSTADVLFERRSDALKAMRQYNGVPLDGQPMDIQVATSLEKARPALNHPYRFDDRRGPRSSGHRQGGRLNRDAKSNGDLAKSGRKPVVSKTVEELDAELDAYISEYKK